MFALQACSPKGNSSSNLDLGEYYHSDKMEGNCHILIFLSIIFAIISGCVNQQEQHTEEKGVVYGNIGIHQGNCMPGPGRMDCPKRGLQTKAYITRASQRYAKGSLVASVETDEKGYFELELAPGQYSLFVYDNMSGWQNWYDCDERMACDENGAYVCNGWSCPDGICICNPFMVESGKRTEVNASINHAAW